MTKLESSLHLVSRLAGKRGAPSLTRGARAKACVEIVRPVTPGSCPTGWTPVRDVLARVGRGRARAVPLAERGAAECVPDADRREKVVEKVPALDGDGAVAPGRWTTLDFETPPGGRFFQENYGVAFDYERW